MNRILLAFGILVLAGFASALFGGSSITMQIFDDSNTTIYTGSGSGGDSNFTDANFWQLLSTWTPISDANLNIPNVWLAIDGNKGLANVDLNAYVNQSTFDSNFANRMPISDDNLDVPNVWSLFPVSDDNINSAGTWNAKTNAQD